MSLTASPNYEVKEFEYIPETSDETRFTFIENFQSYSEIKIDVIDIKKYASVSEIMHLTISLREAGSTKLDLNANLNYPSYVHYQFFKGNQLIKEERVMKLSNEMLSKNIQIDVNSPEQPGTYGLYLTIKTGWLPATLNSKRYKIIVN
jgi:hypothetical protein